MFESYTDSLFNDKIELKSQRRFKSDYHNVYTEKINNIALSSNHDKRLQTFNENTTYPHGTNAFKVCESEMLMVMKYKNFVTIEKNKIFRSIAAKCILSRSIRYLRYIGELLSVIKYKHFFLNNKTHIKKQTGFWPLLLQSVW